MSLEAALATVPERVRDRAARAALLRGTGATEEQVAAALGVSRRTLYRDRLALSRALAGRDTSHNGTQTKEEAWDR